MAAEPSHLSTKAIQRQRDDLLGIESWNSPSDLGLKVLRESNAVGGVVDIASGPVSGGR